MIGDLGACMDSILPSPHDMRVNDAAVVARILGGGRALDAKIVVSCVDTWSDDAPGQACCEHGYMYGCPHGHEPIEGVAIGRTSAPRNKRRKAAT